MVIDEIEKLRERLNELVETKELIDEETLRLSEELDELIIQYLTQKL